MNIEGISSIAEVDHLIDLLLDRRREIQCVSNNALILQIKERVQYYVINPRQFKDEKLSEYLTVKIKRDYIYLSNLFTRKEGISIKKYLIKVRVDEVKILLKIKKYSIKEIAAKLGYSSVAHLCNEFKKIEGRTTFQWKKSNVEQPVILNIMTFEELLKSCASGKMPRVKSTEHFKGHTSTTGTVSTIKSNGKHSGCAVTFDGMAYDTWFHAEWEEDQRKKYMSQLTLLPA